MREINVSLPIYYVVERKTKKNSTHLVGANWFRNLQYFMKNKLKQHYHELVLVQAKDIEPIRGQFITSYKLYWKNKACDATNIISQIEKFALDGLVECYKITDDNVQWHIGSDGWSIEQDKENPRLEIIIKEVL